MKTKVISFLIVVVLLSSCAPQKFYSRKWLGDVPAYTPQAPIKIIYPSDPLPKEPYVEVLRMDVALLGQRNSKRLVAELNNTALHEGVDAVILLDAEKDSLTYSQNRTHYEFDFYDKDPGISEGYINGVFYEMISGIGIKFLHNIDYMNKFLKNEELYLINDTLNAPYLLANISYYPSGSVKDFQSIYPRAEELYLENIKPYARYYLLYDQNGQWHEWFAENRLIKREKYRLDDWMVKRVNIIYDMHGKEEKILIRNNESNFPYSEAIYFFRENGKITKRLIKRQNKPDLVEKLTYDSNYRVIARDIYQVIEGEERHWLKSIYSHYTQEDLKDLISKTVAKEQ